MPDKELEIEISRAGQSAVIVLIGTLNRSTEEILESAYEEARKISGRLLLDFSEVDYINSTGIAAIVGLVAIAVADGRELGAFGLSDHYQEVFKITRLADFVTIYEDLTAATEVG